MKIIHTADFHIGSPLSSRLSGEKREERQNEIISNFRRLVEQAYALGASAIIIAGDLFDENDVGIRAKNAVIETVRWASDITFFLLEGNHDKGITGVMEMPENLFTFGSEWSYYELSEGVTVCGRNFFDENAFESLHLKKEKKNIAVLHGELREHSAPLYTVGLKDAAGKFIDYLALGHYHSYSVTRIDERGNAVYSGTPEGRGFDETGECGFVLIDTDGNGLTHRFIPFARRKIHDIKLPVDGMSGQGDIVRAAMKILENIPSSDMVRLELVGRYTSGIWKDGEALERELKGHLYHLEIKDSSRPKADYSGFTNDKSLKGEFIRAVLVDTTLSDLEKDEVIRMGIAALSGEDGFSL